MPENASTEGIVSDIELVELTELFRAFQGSTEPRDASLKQAELAFNSLASRRLKRPG